MACVDLFIDFCKEREALGERITDICFEDTKEDYKFSGGYFKMYMFCSNIKSFKVVKIIEVEGEKAYLTINYKRGNSDEESWVVDSKQIQL